MIELKLENADEIKLIKTDEDVTLTLDFDYIDSKNIGWLSEKFSELEDNGKELKIKIYSETIQDIFELVWISTIMDVELISKK